MPKVLVIGDLMIDHYLWGSANRISPEAPVQVVDIDNESTVLGGAGNVVNNLRALGCSVGVISAIGKDEAGSELKEMLNSIETKSYLIEQKNRKTSKKSRIIASHSQVVRYDKESKEDIILDFLDVFLFFCSIRYDFVSIELSISFNSLPASSFPIAEITPTLQPNALRLFTTFPAPPKTVDSLSISTT